MSRFIVKPATDVDFYVEWSSIVEEPVYWGTRDDFRSRPDQSVYSQDRFDRADATSSSELWYPVSWDEDEVYIFAQIGWLHRSEIPALIELIEQVPPGERASQSAVIKAFLHPFEDRDSDD